MPARTGHAPSLLPVPCRMAVVAIESNRRDTAEYTVHQHDPRWTQHGFSRLQHSSAAPARLRAAPAPTPRCHRAAPARPRRRRAAPARLQRGSSALPPAVGAAITLSRSVSRWNLQSPVPVPLRRLAVGCTVCSEAPGALPPRLHSARCDVTPLLGPDPVLDRARPTGRPPSTSQLP